ncbi:unnamed protein product, partial [Amoebophrya sp. A25]|eukprot:GSA25T00006584001.1
MSQLRTINSGVSDRRTREEGIKQNDRPQVVRKIASSGSSSNSSSSTTSSSSSIEDSIKATKDAVNIQARSNVEVSRSMDRGSSSTHHR